MHGDYTRFSHDPLKHYSRVLKQQGRVEVDADFNESTDIAHYLRRTGNEDIIGQTGVPKNNNGFRVDVGNNGDLTILPGRMYVDGILCEIEGEDPDSSSPISITNQADLPGYTLPTEPGVYIVYVDVWEKHITYLEDPDIQEVALGGPDTATRVKTICQIKLHQLDGVGDLDQVECINYPAIDNPGRLAAQVNPDEVKYNPCIVPAKGGYRGVENRLYRVEIHSDGRNDDGAGETPTFKWSRDNGAVVLPIAEIENEKVKLKHLGHDKVMTVKVGDWVEIISDESELNDRHGTLAQIVPDGIDKDNLKITLSKDVSEHADKGNLKMRRWDHHATDTVSIEDDGALGILGKWFELEDGIQIGFKSGETYQVGDYWLIPARTREGTIIWPKNEDNTEPAELQRMGIEHHYSTLAVAQFTDDSWNVLKDCRPLFPPLNEISPGCCCVRVNPGDVIQQAVDSVIKKGGGCVMLCQGVHEVDGPLFLKNAKDVKITGVGAASIVRFKGFGNEMSGGILLENSRRISIENLYFVSDDVPALITLNNNEDWIKNRDIILRNLQIVNLAASGRNICCAVSLAHSKGLTIENCRMIADVGILSLWGKTLPDIPKPEHKKRSLKISREMKFDDDSRGTTFKVGHEYIENDSKARFETFNGGNQATLKNKAIFLNNITIDFQLKRQCQKIDLDFKYGGGGVKIRVNKEKFSTSNLGNESTNVGNANVTIAIDRNQTGRLTIEGENIDDFAIGGQEFRINYIAFYEPHTLPFEEYYYGDGVDDVLMINTKINYSSTGIFSLKSNRWNVEYCSLVHLQEDFWKKMIQLYNKAENNSKYNALLLAADSYTDKEVSTLKSSNAKVSSDHIGATAILAFFWLNSTINKCKLSGSHGLQIWLLYKTMISENDIKTKYTGLYVNWPQNSVLMHNRIISDSGYCVGFSGCYDFKIQDNVLEGLSGVINTVPESCLTLLTHIFSLARSGYYSDNVSESTIFWLGLEEVMKQTGFNELLKPLQEIFGRTLKRVPLTYLISNEMIDLLKKIGLEQLQDICAPVINLLCKRNKIVCKERCIWINKFIPISHLHIYENQLKTLFGQALKLEAHKYLSNAQALVMFWRIAYRYAITYLENELKSSGAAKINAKQQLLKTLLKKLHAWGKRSEILCDPNFKIVRNNIQSLKNAIETNLYEIFIEHNDIFFPEHIEKPTQKIGNINGTVKVFGNGKPIVGVDISIEGGKYHDRTDESGKYYIQDLPAERDHTVFAHRSGYVPQSKTIFLGDNDSITVDFDLNWIGLVTFEDDLVEMYRPLSIAKSISDRPFKYARTDNLAFGEMIDTMKNTPLEEIAIGLAEGNHIDLPSFEASLIGPQGHLRDVKHKKKFLEVVDKLACIGKDIGMEKLRNKISYAVNSDDFDYLGMLLPIFITNLKDKINSIGILAKGIGSKIVSNTVTLPIDVSPEIQPLAGIKFATNYRYEKRTLSLLNRIYAKAKQPLSNFRASMIPILEVSETIIRNNEVIGGIGHGISIQGTLNRSEFLADVHIYGNQLRGCAGTGIICDDSGLVVGLYVKGNHISNCGADYGFSNTKGGIVIGDAVFCDVSGNIIESCGKGMKDFSTAGISLDTIYCLTLRSNQLIANGSKKASIDDGAVLLQEIYGMVSIDNNDMLYNRGMSLDWNNSAGVNEAANIPAKWLEFVDSLYGNFPQKPIPKTDEFSSVQNNMFNMDLSGESTTITITNIQNLNFSGNSINTSGKVVSVGMINGVNNATVSNNLFEGESDYSLVINKLINGIILGNTGQKIKLQTPGVVDDGYNSPKVERV